MTLASVETAREVMLASATPLDAETVDLSQALGRTLAQDVVARRPQPPFRASAMDGWAVQASPRARRLAVLGESAAGRGFPGFVGSGQAVRIFTGAAIPDGADCVVVQEKARRDGAAVVVPASEVGQNVRRQGLDYETGARLLAKGTRLDPWRLGLVAAAGLARVEVVRRPLVAVLATGEELVEPGGDPGPFQIFNSGAVAVAGLIRRWGGEPTAAEPVADTVEAIVGAVMAAPCDLLVTIGGASVGEYDLVKPALAGRLGLTLSVEGVAVRPGKPTWFGALAHGRIALGLPGNPASALVCAELFLRPLLRAMQGGDSTVSLTSARSGAPLSANGGREHWMRAKLSREGEAVVATPFIDQDSSLISVFADADALLRRRADVSAIGIGETVEVLALDRTA